MNGAITLDNSSKTNLVVARAFFLSAKSSDLNRSRLRRRYQVEKSLTVKSSIARAAVELSNFYNALLTFKTTSVNLAKIHLSNIVNLTSVSFAKEQSQFEEIA